MSFKKHECTPLQALTYTEGHLELVQIGLFHNTRPPLGEYIINMYISLSALNVAQHICILCCEPHFADLGN